MTICGLNIIWKSLEKDSTKICSLLPKQTHANPAFNESPVISICWYLEFLDSRNYFLFVKIFRSKHIFQQIILFTYFIHFSSSFINPMVYALRISEFRQGLNLFYFRGQENSNTGRINMAADHNNLKLTFKQEVMEDTKL